MAVLAVDRRGSGLSDGYENVSGATQSPVDGVAGARGHHRQPDDFFVEIDLAVAELRQRCGESICQSPPANNKSPQAAIHLFANCFASRIALAYCAKKGSTFDSLTFTSPATDMAACADLPLTKKLRALYPFRSQSLWFASPLRDDWFVSPGPKLDWINDDSQSLSLRSISSDFVRAVAPLDRASKRALATLEQRLLLVTAIRDAMVDNRKVLRRFQRHWKGALRLESFDCEHMIEFSNNAGPQFRQLLGDWILGEDPAV